MAERVAPGAALPGELADEDRFSSLGPAPRPGEPFEPGPPERHLRLVPPKARRRLSGRSLLYGFVAGLVAVGFGLVALHVVIAEVQFKLDSLQQKAASYQERYEKLRLSVAEDEAPARIVRVATESGLRQPASVTYLPAPPRSPGSQGQAASRLAPGSSGQSRSGQSGSSDVVPAPAGPGDWPGVKPYLDPTP
ncbi:MAG: hypothetical protein M1435_03630 [Actinobacteria bacterium]|nr:hypothetical protein [Actinomycetota bacterium]